MITTLLTICINFTHASEFCEGYKQGYIAGHCSSQGIPLNLCVRPIVPICPIPNPGETTYSDGYAQGFREASIDGGF